MILVCRPIVQWCMSTRHHVHQLACFVPGESYYCKCIHRGSGHSQYDMDDGVGFLCSLANLT